MSGEYESIFMEGVMIAVDNDLGNEGAFPISYVL